MASDSVINMAPAGKIDLFRQYKHEYAATGHAQLVTTSQSQYLSVEGMGDPSGPEFAEKLAALYGVAYNMKFASRKIDKDHVVCKLEGIWWANMPGRFTDVPRDQWRYKLLIRTPDFITTEELAASVRVLAAKGDNRFYRQVKLLKLNEGRCVQVLHIGPYEQEQKSIDKMLAFARTQGLRINGLHHEVYLSDPRKTKPAALKTIIRLPVINES